MNRQSLGASIIGVSMAAALVVLSGCSSGSSAGSGGASASAGGGEPTTVGAPATIAGVRVGEDPKIAAMLPGQYRNGLKFSTSAPYPPWESYDKNHQIVGLDIDTGRAISAVFGVPYSITSLDFGGLIPALQAGKYDIITSSMGDTRAREQVINSVDYSEAGNVLIVQAGNPHHINDISELCGQTVARQTGDLFGSVIDSLQGPCKTAGKQPISVKTFPSTSAALLALKSGIVQAQLAGKVLATQTVAANKGSLEIVAPKNLSHGWAPTLAGLQILKGNKNLTDAVAAAVTKLMQDGTLKAIFDKYNMSDSLTSQVWVNHATS